MFFQINFFFIFRSLLETYRNANLNTRTSRNFSAYEAEGKTYAVKLNKNKHGVISISRVQTFGFVLPTGEELIGPTIFFPNTVFSWNVLHARDVNEESLTLFSILDPKIEILIFGYGIPSDLTPEIRNNFINICKKIGMKYEILPTHQAAGLFNFLAEDA
ncbi:conserved hypothetical protein, partial [Pediculus humanus corporis]